MKLLRFAAATVLLLAVIPAAPAAAKPTSAGLFGTQDPTYDGVFRQSLSLIALADAKVPAPRSAREWLLAQQCADGSFQAFRADPEVACIAFDQTQYLGKDSNSTAVAAVALARLGYPERADRAFRWLQRAQNADGGIGFSKGGSSDSVSTALSVWAARATGHSPATVKVGGRSLLSFLRRAMLDCNSPARVGALTFQPAANALADNMTGAQALAALSAMPTAAKTATIVAPRLSCPATKPLALAGIADALAGDLARQLRLNSFAIPNTWSAGTDWSSTAWAVLGLRGSGRGKLVIRQTVANLRANVDAAIRPADNIVAAGRVALMIEVALATGGNPRAFGGRNLIADLKATLQ